MWKKILQPWLIYLSDLCSCNENQDLKERFNIGFWPFLKLLTVKCNFRKLTKH